MCFISDSWHEIVDFRTYSIYNPFVPYHPLKYVNIITATHLRVGKIVKINFNMAVDDNSGLFCENRAMTVVRME